MGAAQIGIANLSEFGVETQLTTLCPELWIPHDTSDRSQKIR
ncbi:hypothetical protein [Vibrio cortegadensis]|uniref:Transposase n=1 Tax=Vibrio cortegadensis TaxID=1328770 RepID=A0ABV4MC23_9VIBR